MSGLMASPSADVSAALATLRDRWGAAAPRTLGALATVPLPNEPDDGPDPAELPALGPTARVFGTGFAGLDAILGPGGVPRDASLALRGSPSSGRTTLALRLAAEAQAGGSIVAWLDLDRSLDPVEAAARGISLEWLVILAPVDLEEGLSMAGALLQARAVDLLVVDLPARLERPARLAERLTRLTALARRAGVLLVVLEPPSSVRGADRDRGGGSDPLTASAGLRLELVRRSWIRLGRDVVGQRTEVAVARNRFGPPGGRAELRILYADGGPRDACLRDGAVLADGPPTERPAPPGRAPTPVPAGPLTLETVPTSDPSDATPPSPLAPSPAPPRPGAGTRRHRCAGRDRASAPRLRVLPERPDRPRRPALDGWDGHRRGPGRPVARRPPRDGARGGSPARTRVVVPRPRAGG
jgi:RecA/RadA recombinase